jgi:hypothetical protein
MIRNNQTCFNNSLQASEQIFATAPNVNFWILIEYKDFWEEKAFNNCDIDIEVKNVIRDLAGQYPKSRIQLIRNELSSKDHIKLYIAITKETERKVYEFKVESHQDILNIDFNRGLSDRNLKPEPILLVCTHGSHDKCCGEKGLELFNNLSKHEKDFEVWQTTHLGGHRFAANILILPDGIYYGRITKDNYEKIINSHLNNNLEINMLRGRCFYHPEVQAAEYYLRSELKYSYINSLNLISQSTTETGIVNVIFEIENSDNVFEVLLEKNDKALQLFASCRDKHKKFIAQYKLMSISKK